MKHDLKFDFSNLYFKFIKRAKELAADKGADFYLCSYPKLKDNGRLSPSEQYLLNTVNRQNIINNEIPSDKIFIENNYEWLQSNPPHLRLVYQNIPEYSDEYIKKVFTLPTCYENVEGIRVYDDMSNGFTTIINGIRKTTDNPDNYDKTIYLFGNSYVFCIGSEDSNTIASYLQKILNKEELAVKVVNCGVSGSRLDQLVQRIGKTDFQKGDIVLLFETKLEVNDSLISANERVMSYCMHEGIKSIRMDSLFQRPHNYGEVFYDKGHCGPKGNMAIAKTLFRQIFDYETLFLASESLTEKYYNKFIKEYERNNEVADSLEKYLEKIKNLKVEKSNIGSIVMNCNPFTNGHRYLIETAAAKVDHLYIFVVEEDLSFFKFDDRIELIRKGVSDISNVTVVPGGKLIISAITFPTYFVKDMQKEVTIDASYDLTIFAKYICPVLNIKTRFVGHEPFCPVTNQYNEQMRKVMNMFGINFIEITRFEHNNLAISASRVRKLLEEKDFSSIKKIVPKTTYDFLIKTYS